MTVLRRMNESRDTNILTAATRACDATISATEDLEAESLKFEQSSSDIYGIQCVMGPIKGEAYIRELVRMWEKLSRGPQPRTITGYNLAMVNNLNFTVNFPLFFQLNPDEVSIELSNFSMENGSDINIIPLVENVSCMTPPSRQGKKKSASIAMPRKRPPPTIRDINEAPAKRKNR